MSEPAPWTADRDLDLESATRAIAQAVPTLADAPIESLGHGWDFDTYLADGRWVFRFPRRRDGQEALRKDLAVLPWVADGVDLPVPCYAWGALEAEAFPYVFSGYALLPGRQAAQVEPEPELQAALGTALGRFFARLHALRPPAALVREARLDDPLVDPGPLRDHMRRYLGGFAQGEPELAGAARGFFDDPACVPPAHAGEPCLLHADLHAEHLLLDPAEPTRITGLIDWSDARVGDPARDFACIYSWGGETLLAAMLAAYGADDPTLESRARFLGTCFAFMDWSWWTEVGNERAARAARRTLARALA